MTARSALFKPHEERLVRAVSGIAFGNPFLPGRIAFEKGALGDHFIPGEDVWSLRTDMSQGNRNVVAIGFFTEAMAIQVRERLTDRKVKARGEELALFFDLVVYLLFGRYQMAFYEVIRRTAPGESAPMPFYEDFRRDFAHFLQIDGVEFPAPYDPAHLFACFFQVRRAFHHIFDNIIGTSMASARLRAAVWQSIFTHDIRRFQRSLYARMSDVTTLIIGPTGTGKELVARAIGLSRYLPFDERQRRFAADPSASFQSVNLSALSPTIIESELFGHRKGAFTGALSDRKGWLETCGTFGTVFLDEIGELDPAIQVKLLRVLQSRTFQRLGDTVTRHFQGKIIAATNRDLARDIAAGTFREDFFYRLCSDLIATPSLHEQLHDSSDELGHLVRYVASRVAGDEEAGPLSREVDAYVEKHLGADYPWPGNFRELEQCVRSIMIRGEYRPLQRSVRDDRRGQLADEFLAGSMTADDLLNAYSTIVYGQTGSYVETAQRLGIDRRTVKARVDRRLLTALKRRTET